MQINVANTSPADMRSLRECIDIVSREANFLASPEAPSEQELALDLLASARRDSIHLVAKDAQRVVAWAQIERGKGTSVEHRGDLGMGVLPQYRGHGLGKRLLTDCIAAARGRGIDRIELEVRSDNRRALSLYCSVGFAVESIVKRAMKTGDVYHDAFRMCLMSNAQAGRAPVSGDTSLTGAQAR
jgi:ribosomal protein S18 acetylase RimI-like enzyme